MFPFDVKMDLLKFIFPRILSDNANANGVQKTGWDAWSHAGQG